MTVLNAAELAALAADAFDTGAEPIQGLPPGFVRLNVTGEVASDFHGTAYYSTATGELVVAYVGADSLRSLFTNLSFVESTAADSALNRALAFLEAARDAAASAYGAVVSDASITLTGHGVGGGFASLVSVATGLDAATFNGTRIGALMSAMEERFGPLSEGYAGRIVNYVLNGEEASTLPRGAAQVGTIIDVAASDLTFFGQLSTALGTLTAGSAVLDSIYDWLAADSDERQRAQRTLMALELQFGAVGAAAPDAAQSDQLTQQLNGLMQTAHSDVVRSRSFDRLMLDGSDGGRVQDSGSNGASNDLLVGADGADTLVGGGGSDVLFGGNGNDILAGGAGDDFLAGDGGSDLYRFASSDGGTDTVRDAAGSNRLLVDGEIAGSFFIRGDDGVYRSADGALSLEAGADPLLRAGAASIRLEQGSFEQLGWTLFASRTDGGGGAALSGDAYAGYPEDFLEGGSGADRVLAGEGGDVVFGYGGADFVHGGNGQDYLRGDGDGSAGADRLVGGAGADLLFGDGGDDVLFAEEQGTTAALLSGTDPGVAARGDWLAGGEGDDWLFGSTAGDLLSGGGGRDLLAGGAGDDFLYGDGDYETEAFDWTVRAEAGGRTNLSRSPGAVNDPASSAADLLYGGAGNDWMSGGRGDDVLFGEAGNDTMMGNLGADSLSGGEGADLIFGGQGVQGDQSDRGDDYVAGGLGDDSIFGSAGNNWLFGGAGNDTIAASAGEDYVDAGDGSDRVFLQGRDVAYGGGGDDVITTFSTADVFIDGGDGNDVLSGDQGADTLVGGTGADTLSGNEGDDTLDGGEGDDLYRFAAGDGVDEILDAGGDDTIEIVSYDLGDAAQAVTRDQIRLVADESNLWLAYGAGEDRVRLGADPRGVIENVALRTISGSVETVERWSLASMGVTLEGSTASEALFAVAGFANTLTGGDGRDLLFGGDQSDMLIGGAGDDLLKGGEGDDRYVVGPGSGVDTIDDDGLRGSDTVELGVGIDAATLGLAGGAFFIGIGAGAGVKVVGFDAANALTSVGIERFQFLDGTLDAAALLARGFDIAGGDAAATLTGTSVNDRFRAGRGNEKLVGGKGDDTYTFGRGSGRDQIVDQDATSGNFDRVVFTDGIRSTDVSVSAQSDRIVLSLDGSEDSLEIQWAPDSGARIESIEFADTSWNLAAIEALFQPANAEPGLASPIIDQTVLEDAAFRFALPSGTFRDPDSGDTLTLSATLDGGAPLPSWLAFDGAVFSGTPSNVDVGSYSVRVVARDSTGATAADVFEISVQNVNDAPTLAAPIAGAEAFEDEGFAFTIPAGTFIDVDAGDALRYVATLERGGKLPEWLTFDETTGTFLGTPGNDDVGALAVRVLAVDESGAIAEDVFDLYIVNENDAPELAAPLDDVVGREGHAFEFEVPAGTFFDIDRGDSLTLSATLADGEALPPWLVYDAEAGLFLGAPLRADVGTYTVRLTATDSAGAAAFDEFELTIEAVPGQVLTGGSGDDVLVGDAGDDTLAGRGGADFLSGGAGDDAFAFFRDAVWFDSARRTNLGSPDGAGTGETASIGRRTRSYDVFVGGDGVDTLRGTGAGDAILLDDVLSPPAGAGARIQSIEAILAGGGNDVVDLTSADYSLGDVRVEGGGGSDVIWASGGDDILLGGSGADRIFGGAGDDYLAGGGGGDDLNGGLGLDVIQGDTGNDRMMDVSGNNVLDGRNGADDILDGAGSAFIAGGRGNDRITLGGGSDVIAFNRGDGRDVVRGQGAATLSIGGGIRFDELALRRSGADLLMEMGRGDRITLQEWYAAPANASVLNLQVITEVMQGYDPASSDPLLNRKVQQFDFSGIVAEFDAARAAQPALNRWSMMNALLDQHLGGSDSTAIGGDLAHQYGLSGALTGMGLASAQEVIGASSFGSSAQELRPAGTLGAGPIKLV